MTTYRIRPLVWKNGKCCDAAWITENVGYLAFPDGYWHGVFYESESVPHGKEGNLASAKAACESHWREVMLAALEPVEGT